MNTLPITVSNLMKTQMHNWLWQVWDYANWYAQGMGTVSSMQTVLSRKLK